MKLPYLPLWQTLKPLVPVSILGARPLTIRALVDSGADFSIFDLSVANYIGVRFDPQLQRQFAGIGGMIVANGAWLEAIVAKRHLRLLAFFAPNLPINLLGRDNFFHYFRVCFDELNHEFELRFRRSVS